MIRKTSSQSARCKICGKEMTTPMFNDSLCSVECFRIDYWNRALDHTAIIIDGVCYHDAGFVPHPHRCDFLGHGGNSFYIQMESGEAFETNNLWRQGEVPKERHAHNNAKFITKAEFEILNGDDKNITKSTQQEDY